MKRCPRQTHPVHLPLYSLWFNFRRLFSEVPNNSATKPVAHTVEHVARPTHGDAKGARDGK